jgi:hypothetical protein
MENSLVWKSNVTTPIRNLAIDLWSKLQDFWSELRSIWVKVWLKAETLFDESYLSDIFEILLDWCEENRIYMEEFFSSPEGSFFILLMMILLTLAYIK